MGYAVIMFCVLIIMSVVMVTVATYGIAKESQVMPLRAENIYAEREAEKAQTGLMINNTCLSGSDRYLTASGNNPISGPHTLNLVVKNNGSTLLNPNIATVLYNTSYINLAVTHWDKNWNPHWEEDGGKWKYKLDEICRENPENFTVWTPLSYACMKVSNIFISTPNNAPGYALRLLVAAENGVSAIAPTSPTNFTGKRDTTNTSYRFSWNASSDEDGIAYYRLYGLDSVGDIGDCEKYNTFSEIPGNISSFTYDYSFTCGTPGNPCNADWYYLTAVDKLQNEGIQSRTIKCTPNPDAVCAY